MKKYLLLCLICVLLVCGCGKIPKLQNGEEAVVTFAKGDKKHQISAEELFKVLKDQYGLEATIDLIDKYIYETEFSDKVDTASSYADDFIESMIKTYEGEDKFLEAIQTFTNFETIDAYRSYVYLTYLKDLGKEEYANSLVTDKEMEDYYKNEAKGDIEVYHILITPDVTSDMTTTEKKEAEDKAKSQAEEIIKTLKEVKKGEDVLAKFKELVQEYSEDEDSKSNDGNLGYINTDFGEDYQELIDEAYKLKDGEYSKSVITTSLGYHVIYRNASKEKEDYETLKDEIKETLANRKLKDSKITINAEKYYRDLYNMDIIDDELDRQYGLYLNSVINSTNNSTEEE